MGCLHSLAQRRLSPSSKAATFHFSHHFSVVTSSSDHKLKRFSTFKQSYDSIGSTWIAQDTLPHHKFLNFNSISANLFPRCKIIYTHVLGIGIYRQCGNILVFLSITVVKIKLELGMFDAQQSTIVTGDI